MAKLHKAGNRRANESKSRQELEMNRLKRNKQILQNLERLDKAIIKKE